MQFATMHLPDADRNRCARLDVVALDAEPVDARPRHYCDDRKQAKRFVHAALEQLEAFEFGTIDGRVAVREYGMEFVDHAILPFGMHGQQKQREGDGPAGCVGRLKGAEEERKGIGNWVAKPM